MAFKSALKVYFCSVLRRMEHSPTHSAVLSSVRYSEHHCVSFPLKLECCLLTVLLWMVFLRMLSFGCFLRMFSFGCFPSDVFLWTFPFGDLPFDHYFCISVCWLNTLYNYLPTLSIGIMDRLRISVIIRKATRADHLWTNRHRRCPQFRP